MDFQQRDKHSMDINGDHDNDEREAAYELEIDALKANLKALNMQMFQEKKQWLAEKMELEKAVGSVTFGGRSFNSAGSQSQQPRRATGGLERSPGVDRSGTLQDAGLRDRSFGSTGGVDRTSTVSSLDDSMVLRAQLQAVQSSLSTMTAERDAAREEVWTMKAQAQRWNVERVALQREVDVLRASTGRRNQSESGGDLTAALAASEEERAALTSELELIKQSLKNNVLVPRAHMAQLTASQCNSPVPNGRPPLSHSNSSNNISPTRTHPSPGGHGVDPAATIARLNAEITRLQADLYIIKDECVPVPKAEFASLKGVHSEKASTEQELRSVRQELADVSRLNKMLREEMELIKEEHMAITLQEYDELRRAAAEKQALELKLEAQAKYYTQVPKEELAEMQSARRSVAGLETRLAAMQAVTAINKDDTSRALQVASSEAADLRVKLMESEASCADLRKEVVAGEGRAGTVLELQDKLRASEAALAAAQQEKARLTLRVRALEDELEACKQVMKDAQGDSARVAVELGAARDHCSGLAQEVSTLTRERGELESRVTEYRSEREALTNELVDAKLELARLREMEVIFRKTVLNNQKQLYGLPSSYADTQ